MDFILKYLFPDHLTIRKQLMLVFSVGSILLIIIASLTTAWLEKKRFYTYLVNEGHQITSNFSNQSALALESGNKQSAIDFADATLALSTVDHVGVYNAKGRVLLRKGQQSDWYLDKIYKTTKPQLIKETDKTLHFINSVYAHKRSKYDGNGPLFLGNVHVVIGLSALPIIWRKAFIENIIISLILAPFFLALLHIIASHITTPLSKISKAMDSAESGKKNVRSNVKGSAEVNIIAQAFNRMMETLDDRQEKLLNQKKILSIQVAERTRELVIARDKALKATRLKSDFLANMSHELRTPINAIIGYTEMSIEELDPNTDISKDLQRVLAASDDLLKLINSILDLAKIEAGYAEVCIIQTDLNKLINHTIDIARPLALKNDNNLTFNIEQHTTEVLYIDDAKLQQIILNILSNACKFTTCGKITLNVHHKKEELMITMHDTGIGMSESQKNHIFDEFYQADMSITRNYGGTGLGLAISQRLCQLMGGKINVHSEINEGTTFTILIPLPINEKNQVAHFSKEKTTFETYPSIAENI